MGKLIYKGKEEKYICFDINNYWILIEDYDLVKYGNLNEFDRPILDVIVKELTADLGELFKKDSKEGKQEGVLYIDYNNDKNKNSRVLEVNYNITQETIDVIYVGIDYRTLYLI